jgi:hypothetical protein
MDFTTPAQILLDGSVEQEQPESIQAELARFSAASAEEHGLVNLTQGGVILSRSKQLVQRLVAQRRLTPFEFFGRTYLSVRELKEFEKVERLPGRPWGKRMVAAAKVAASAMVDPGHLRYDVTKDFKKPSQPVVE